jgi:hypothetical protein
MTLKTKAGRSKLARARKLLTTDEMFFYENAGYSYSKDETPQDGRIRCARELAYAESVAKDKSWYCEWVADDDADLSWMTEEEQSKEHETWGCILKNADAETLESLWGITDPNKTYGRVIEAELADEHLAVEHKRLESLRESIQHMN